MSTKSAAKEHTINKVKEPKQYNVIMLNDDFTTMAFVVNVLITIFHKDELTAETIMLTVHKIGRAVVGKYPYDIASTRVKAALTLAKKEGFPFRMTIEEA